MLNKNIICVTGKSGSGKTTFAKTLSKVLNAEFVNVDEVAHAIYNNKEVCKAVKKSFGKDVFNGKLVDTKKLGKIVFNSVVAMQSLTEITWPFMEEEINKIIKNSNKNFAVLDWALIPFTPFFINFSFNILLSASDNIRKQKILKRDNISLDYLLMRESNSLDYSKYQFNEVINNKYDSSVMEICLALATKIENFFKGK